MGNKLVVAYSCNDGYILQTGISLISLFENNRSFNQIEVVLISKGISRENIVVIEKICERYNRTLRIVDFDQIAYDLKLTSTGRHIATIYAKIFFSRLSAIDKILYIDSDTIINGSVAEFYNTDLSDSYMGMVKTYTGEEAKNVLGMKPDASFFNDGVALVNVDYCRKNNLITKCLSVINSYDGNPPVLSEGVLNKVCEGHIKTVSPRFNMMAGLYQIIRLDPTFLSKKLNYSESELRDSCRNPVIIHYLSGFYDRPWNKGCSHPLRDIFLQYKSISPWKDTPLYKRNLSIRLKFLGIMLNIIGPYKFEKIQKLLKRK
ncbi:glycosyltransferase family 8 protein [Parabacteroides sp. ZJ-118]|uniref:glycosyltransferase family 8 protein n=1 Tax=Parabacteroides sp. ZJ-118 TaxID=2709398 RepID=UPI0013EB9441|nr:glycosyltransferase family 8 protein [Parabacteroides sp. ZJ-118]